jgi:hypothetical protein
VYDVSGCRCSTRVLHDAHAGHRDKDVTCTEGSGNCQDARVPANWCSDRRRRIRGSVWRIGDDERPRLAAASLAAHLELVERDRHGRRSHRLPCQREGRTGALLSAVNEGSTHTQATWLERGDQAQYKLRWWGARTARRCRQCPARALAWMAADPLPLVSPERATGWMVKRHAGTLGTAKRSHGPTQRRNTVRETSSNVNLPCSAAQGGASQASEAPRQRAVGRRE